MRSNPDVFSQIYFVVQDRIIIRIIHVLCQLISKDFNNKYRKD